MQKTILIVDDNAHIRRSLRWIIEQQLHWNVCGEAANGAEGVSAAMRLKPDIVVLDLSMPVMNGFEAARILKRSLPSTQLLMFTAFSAPSMEEAARTAGIDGFVAKTDGVTTLVDNLQRVAALRASPLS